jgi:hypothetical protein
LATLYSIPIVYRRTHRVAREELGLIDGVAIAMVLLSAYGLVATGSRLLGVGRWTSDADIGAHVQPGLWFALVCYVVLVWLRAEQERWPRAWNLCKAPLLRPLRSQFLVGVVISGVGVSLGLWLL